MKSVIFFIITLTIFLTPVVGSGADVEWNLQQSINIESAPLDAFLDGKSKNLYILNEKKEIVVYTLDGKVKGRFSAGEDVEKIMPGSRPDEILLSRPQAGTIDVIDLDFIRNIPVDGSPVRGREDAPVTIAVFSDFQCRYCSQLTPLLDSVLSRHPNDVKIVFKNFPIRSHRFAIPAAKAALAANKFGKFWEMHDLLFKSFSSLNDEVIKGIVKKLGLDTDEFQKALNDPTLEDQIKRDVQEGMKAEVRGTPTVFIGGRTLRVRSPKGFDDAIAKALEKK